MQWLAQRNRPKETKTFVLYQIRDPRTNEPFYAGITSDLPNRIAHHLKGHTPCAAAIRQFDQTNTLPAFVIVDKIHGYERAKGREIDHIATLLLEGYTLANTDGELAAAKRLIRAERGQPPLVPSQPAKKATDDPDDFDLIEAP